MTRRGAVLFAAMCVIWGIPYLLIRVAVRELTPGTLVFARTFPAAVLLVPLAAARGQLRPVLARWRPVALYTVVELCVPWLLLSTAEERLSSSEAALLIATVPLLGVVVARLGGGERVDRRRLAGLACGLFGVAAVVGLDVHGTPLAVAEGLVVAAGYATGPFLVSRQLSDLPSLGVVAASLALTAVVYAPVAATHWPGRLSAEVVGAVAVLALVCTALAFLLFFALIAEVGPARATVITYVNPAVAVLLGVWFLHEPLTAGLVIGFPLIVVGSVLATGRSAVGPVTVAEP
jgi:drug/metabolite transporter (DMT)-like permease